MNNNREFLYWKKEILSNINSSSNNMPARVNGSVISDYYELISYEWKDKLHSELKKIFPQKVFFVYKTKENIGCTEKITVEILEPNNKRNTKKNISFSIEGEIAIFNINCSPLLKSNIKELAEVYNSIITLIKDDYSIIRNKNFELLK